MLLHREFSLSHILGVGGGDAVSNEKRRHVYEFIPAHISSIVSNNNASHLFIFGIITVSVIL